MIKFAIMMNAILVNSKHLLIQTKNKNKAHIIVLKFLEIYWKKLKNNKILKYGNWELITKE